MEKVRLATLAQNDIVSRNRTAKAGSQAKKENNVLRLHTYERKYIVKLRKKMNYQDALVLIHREFETRYGSDNSRVLRINRTYDGTNEFYISIEDADVGALLTDDGITKDIFHEVLQEDWMTLCEKNGFIFRNWNIERKFRTMDDLYAFIDFLDLIADKYCPIEKIFEKTNAYLQ